MFHVHVKHLGNEPCDERDMYFEINEDRLEVRKVYFYYDGRIERAGDGISTADTWISPARFPTIETINEEVDFRAAEISAESFEAAWGKGQPR